ncbi:MAG: WecB/TagA/CpsF family glycosyltransferase [Patescibacteria group bacterium]|nr:WecB/TagA/CpsF family glycosyltransferase [Patescibacteria group bacterium]
MNNKKNKIFDIEVVPLSKKIILEKILKFIEKPKGFFHIVSLNPENLVIAQENYYFKKVLCQAPLKIVDGFGIVIASKILGFEAGERIAGVDLMKELIDLASKIRLRVMLIGGRPELAKSITVCYQKKYPEARFLGIEGIKDIKNKNKIEILKEEKEIFKIVADFKPQVVFVAFGSPYQELWIERHKNKFDGCVVMGVGGGFDFLSGKVIRAPKIIRKIGFEWLFRLLRQPWRWKRQLRLIKFLWLVVKESIKKS